MLVMRHIDSAKRCVFSTLQTFTAAVYVHVTVVDIRLIFDSVYLGHATHTQRS